MGITPPNRDGEILKAIKDLETRMDQRFEEIDQRFERVETEIGSLTRLVEGKFANLEERLDCAGRALAGRTDQQIVEEYDKIRAEEAQHSEYI